MATKDYGQTYYATDADAVDVAAISEATAESIEGRTVMSFASTGARDTALATLTTEQKKGVVAHVMGKGLYYYTGSTWRYVSANGEKFTQCGVATTAGQNPVGLASVTFPVAFGSGDMPVVVANHATSLDSALPLLVRQYIASGWTTNTTFWVSVRTPSGSAYLDPLQFTWIAHGPRAAD